MESSVEIVKVQRAQFPSDGPASVYARGHLRQAFVRLWPWVDKQMVGEDRAFFQARWINGSWLIGKRVEDQTW